MINTTEPELVDKTKTDIAYLMENDEEALRLEIKTDIEAVRDEAKWCGLKPGMRVLDAGCGPGLVTSILHELIRPDGFILGVDYSAKRIEYASKKYAKPNEIEFYMHDLREPFKDIGTFDLIWARFVLEYFRKEAFSIVKNLTKLLKPGGYLFLLDLDYDCLTHYELPVEMGKILHEVMIALENNYNFDPYAGRRLYAYLYDLGFKSIELNLKAHHLIYGLLSEEDLFNWTKKIHVACMKTNLIFKDYPGQIDGFLNDFKAFFCSPRRLTYTPLLICKGRK